jgi:predicted 2-oxoglutarate/Fe(II)-dependent dioxygenase YbiX
MQTAAKNNQAVAGMRGDIANAEPLNMRKRIGSTVYEVRMCFNQDTKETMEDKLLRLVRNDLNKPPMDAKMALPQTSWLPERSSL